MEAGQLGKLNPNPVTAKSWTVASGKVLTAEVCQLHVPETWPLSKIVPAATPAKLKDGTIPIIVRACPAPIRKGGWLIGIGAPGIRNGRLDTQVNPPGK